LSASANNPRALSKIAAPSSQESPRPPQGHPLLVQAGSSEAGKALAAAWSDMHFVFILILEMMHLVGIGK
jgi:alkanesulfonate monooxygenase SsuD/methylene tetrahydromethanopterin reductase-like flavin-dependent oxidoreductase (luciferase family)